MIMEHIGLSEINGPLVVLDGVEGVQYDEMAELHLGRRQHPRGPCGAARRATACVVQVFEGTRGLCA